MDNISNRVAGPDKQLIIHKLLKREVYKSSDDRQLYELTLQELRQEYHKYMIKKFEQAN